MSVYLKVKIKSLASEAAIIRKEERKRLGSSRYLRSSAKEGQNDFSDAEQELAVYDRLHQHRTGIVRREARASSLAYGFLRGRSLDQVESRQKEPPPWASVLRMVLEYSPNKKTRELVKKELTDWIERSSISRQFYPHWL